MFRPIGVVGVLLIIGGPAAIAQDANQEAQKRKVLVPYIRAATDCIAQEALKEPGIGLAFRDGRPLAALTPPISRCAEPIARMTNVHDSLYYSGSGVDFYKGPYLQDLARAIQRRVGSELQRLANEEAARRLAERAEAEQRRAEADRRRAEEEARTAQLRAETERREADRKIEAEKQESDRRAELIRQADLKRQQLDAASRATDLLRDRMYECARHEIADMVKSGEGAEVLASAAMTLCSREVDKTLDGLIEARKIESGAVIGYAEIEAVKSAGRAAIKDNVMAAAVKAKAARASGSTY